LGFLRASLFASATISGRFRTTHRLGKVMGELREAGLLSKGGVRGDEYPALEDLGVTRTSRKQARAGRTRRAKSQSLTAGQKALKSSHSSALEIRDGLPLNEAYEVSEHHLSRAAWGGVEGYFQRSLERRPGA
jgi:hypothetical protein